MEIELARSKKYSWMQRPKSNRTRISAPTFTEVYKGGTILKKRPLRGR
jgi:hypothetical protein